MTVLIVAAPVVSVRADDDVAVLRQHWAELKYEHANDRDRVAAAETLEREAAAVAEREPSPAALLLQANILCLTAAFMHSSASLAKVRTARDVLVRAERADPNIPEVLAALGSIYYEVPNWPIGFGDRKKAEEYLHRAIALDPDGRDTNYFMGDFLLETGRAGQAGAYLEHALAAPQQGTVFDRGRREEIAKDLLKVRRRLRR
jgi:tetratricopeptide (TPR) repeat protein